MADEGGTMAFIDLAAQRRRLGDRVDRAVQRVLEHGRYVMGPEVHELERRLAEHSGAAEVVTCSSGTDALLLPLLAWGVGPGDAVFVPAFTFPATPEVAALLGATPVFVDVDRVTFTMDPKSLDAAVGEASSRGLQPKVVVAVDLYGHPARYDDVEALADTHGMRVLADAAQSYGASRGGRRVGRFGDATATSFFPAKPLGCYGDGGAVFTDDEELAALLRSLRVHGQGDTKYDVVRVGINGRLDTVQAAVLLEKLSIFDEELEARDRVAGRYSEALQGAVEVPAVDEDVVSAWAQYTIRLEGRDAVARRLGAEGIPTAVYYPRPLHEQPAYASCPVSPLGLTVSEESAERVLSLPMHPYLEEADQERITTALLASLG